MEDLVRGANVIERVRRPALGDVCHVDQSASNVHGAAEHEEPRSQHVCDKEPVTRNQKAMDNRQDRTEAQRDEDHCSQRLVLGHSELWLRHDVQCNGAPNCDQCRIQCAQMWVAMEAEMQGRHVTADNEQDNASVVEAVVA